MLSWVLVLTVDFPLVFSTIKLAALEASVYFLIFRLSSRGLKADGAMSGMLYVTRVIQNRVDTLYLDSRSRFCSIKFNAFLYSS